MKFCSHCGSRVERKIPEGEDRERYVCPDCQTIHYQNPNVVVGSIPLYLDKNGVPKILLCRRGIEPRLGYWTLPAGFLENDESSQQGALRETAEEACAEIVNLELYRVLNVVQNNQIHMFFRADLPRPDYAVTAESTEIDLFDFESIPWNQLAFPTVHRTLKDFIAEYEDGGFTVRLAEVQRQDWESLDQYGHK